jgi:hypothetical protein
MDMKNIKITAIAAALGLGLTISAGAMAQNMTKEQFKAGLDGIAADYKGAVAACGSLSANAKDICRADASGKQKVAKAELEGKYKPSEGATYRIRVAIAEADYGLAREKCDDLAGNVKDVCVKEAKAVAVAAKADAKTKLKTSNAKQDAAATSAAANAKAQGKAADARKDASADKRDAEYAVAIEKCDAFSGEVKSNCTTQAKVRFGKT